MTRAFLFLLLTLLISSCIQDPQGFLRKSANNRYFDDKGADKSKRMPAYNMKHIELAKRNMSSNRSYEEDIEDEFESPELYHREIYKQMVIEEEATKKPTKKNKKQYRTKKHNISQETEIQNISHNIPMSHYSDDLFLDEIIDNKPQKQINIANDQFVVEKEKLTAEISNMKLLLDTIKTEISNLKNKPKFQTASTTTITTENSNKTYDQNHILLNTKHKDPPPKVIAKPLPTKTQIQEIVTSKDKATSLMARNNHIILNTQHKDPAPKVIAKPLPPKTQIQEIVISKDKATSLMAQNNHIILNTQHKDSAPKVIAKPLTLKTQIKEIVTSKDKATSLMARNNHIILNTQHKDPAPKVIAKPLPPKTQIQEIVISKDKATSLMAQNNHIILNTQHKDPAPKVIAKAIKKKMAKVIEKQKIYLIY